MDQRKIFGECIAAGNLHFGPVLFGEGPTRRLELAWPHIIGWRIDEIAAEAYALDDASEIVAINAVWNNEADISRICFLITGILISAECKRECRQACVVRRVCETINARRQNTGQLARPKAVESSVVERLNSEQRAGERSVSSGEQRQPAGPGLKTCCHNEFSAVVA